MVPTPVQSALQLLKQQRQCAVKEDTADHCSLCTRCNSNVQRVGTVPTESAPSVGAETADTPPRQIIVYFIRWAPLQLPCSVPCVVTYQPVL